MRFWERWENAILKSSLATWLTPAGAHHVCQGTSLGHTPPQLRLPRATFGPCFQQPVRPAARNVTQKPQVPQVRTPLAARLRARPSCSASHAIVLVRADRVQPVNAAWPVAGQRWAGSRTAPLAHRQPRDAEPEAIGHGPWDRPGLPGHGPRAAPPLRNPARAGSPICPGDGARSHPALEFTGEWQKAASRGDAAGAAPLRPPAALTVPRTGAGARLERRAGAAPAAPVRQGCGCPGGRTAPGAGAGAGRHGTARKGAAGRGSGHRRQTAARHFLTPPNFIGRRRGRTQPPPR